jgi:hypothetical protein
LALQFLQRTLCGILNLIAERFTSGQRYPVALHDCIEPTVRGRIDVINHP